MFDSAHFGHSEADQTSIRWIDVPPNRDYTFVENALAGTTPRSQPASQPQAFRHTDRCSTSMNTKPTIKQAKLKTKATQGETARPIAASPFGNSQLTFVSRISTKGTA